MTGSANKPSILVDGSLLLGGDQTGIASFTRSLASGLHAMGASVNLLLSSRAHPIRGAPAIALADQVFSATRIPRGRRAQLAAQVARLVETRLGFRRKLSALPVSLDGVELAALQPRLPPFHAVYNASNFLAHSRAVFAMRACFTELRVDQPIDAVHWTVPAPVLIRGKPSIYTIHDVIPLKFPQFSLDVAGRAAVLHGEIARMADHIMTVSERSREDIRSILGVPEERISVVYQPVPPMASVGRVEAERLVSNLYGAAPGEYVFFCGAIEPKKNLLRLIEAFSAADIGQQLLIAGPLGWLYDDVQDLLSRVAASGVRYLGYLPRRHIAALMECACFFVFPSIYEGFGIPPLEAMQLGTPVLTSHGGSLPEVVGDAAITVDPLDVDAIAAAIRQLAGDADLRRELARRGMARARRFSPQAFAAQLSLAYRKIGISIAPPETETALCNANSASAPSCARSASTPPPGAIPAPSRTPTSTSPT